MPVLALGVSYRRAPLELLERLSLGEDEYTKAYRRLSELESVEEAVLLSNARALVHQPALLIADEPTGNLDSQSASTVLRLLAKIGAERLTTLIVVTHSIEVARTASRRVEMRDGKVVSDSSFSPS